jgi:hypothetical protein
LQKGFEKAH